MLKNNQTFLKSVSGTLSHWLIKGKVSSNDWTVHYEYHRPRLFEICKSKLESDINQIVNDFEKLLENETLSRNIKNLISVWMKTDAEICNICLELKKIADKIDDGAILKGKCKACPPIF